MKKVKKIKVISLGKIFGVMYALMGLLFGGVVTILAIFGNAFSTPGNNFGGVFFGVGAIILIPIIYGALGFILGVILSWLFNIAAQWFGGLEVDIE